MIRVIDSGAPIQKPLSEEVIPQNNCRGNSPVSNLVERSRTISRSAELGGGATISGSGEVGVPGIGGVQVGAEIAATYNTSYGEEETVSRNITLTAKEGSSLNHRVRQYELWRSGEVVISVGDDELARYPYEFRTDFGLELVDVQPIDCSTTSTASPAPSVAPTAPPTSAPPTSAPAPTGTATQPAPAASPVAGEPTAQPPLPEPPIATDIPGSPLPLDTEVKSVLDAETRPIEVYSVGLKAGQKVRIVVKSDKRTFIGYANPDQASFNGNSGVSLCDYATACAEVFAVAVDGVYHVRVSTDQPGVSYSLLVSIEGEIPVTTTPGDIPGVPLALGQSISSVLDVQTKPMDVFSVNLEAGQKVRVLVKSDKRTFIGYANPDQASFNGNAGVSLCDYATACAEVFAVAVGGTYYIRVSTDQAAVPYSLTVSIESTAELPATESDIPGVPLALGQTVTSILDFQTKPLDAFSVDLEAGQKVRVLVKSDKRTFIGYANPDQASFNGNSGVTLCNYATACAEVFAVAVGGTYYIRVSTDQAAVPYSLTVSIDGTTPAPATASDIPGVPLAFGQPVSSVLDVQTKPVDVFSVDLEAGQKVRVLVKSDKRTFIGYANPDQASFASERGTDLCNYATACSELLTAAAAGTYYLRIGTDQAGVIYTVTVNPE